MPKKCRAIGDQLTKQRALGKKEGRGTVFGNVHIDP